MKFHKMHGLGNDFVIFDVRHNTIDLTSAQISKICNRHFGVGCDQLIVIKNHPDADAQMIIYNHNGSQGKACGNATRCAFKLISNIDNDQGPKSIFVFDKIIKCSKTDKNLILVDMGTPKIMPSKENLHISSKDINSTNITLHKWCDVDMGNPHIVIFDDLNHQQRSIVGDALQTHPKYPEGINVNFVNVINDNSIELQTRERGAGFTNACGSGACASVAAANTLGHTGDSVLVKNKGGDLNISYQGQSVLMEGPATHVFTAEINLEAL